MIAGGYSNETVIGADGNSNLMVIKTEGVRLVLMAQPQTAI